MTHANTQHKPIEIWRQDNLNPDLWHSSNTIMVNSAALDDREFYFELVRVPSPSFIDNSYISSLYSKQ